MTLWYSLSDGNYNIWQLNFETETGKYETELELTPLQLNQIGAAGLQYRAALENLQVTRAAYEAAVLDKNKAKAAAIELNRTFVAKFQAITGLSNEIYQSLQIPERGAQGTKGQAITPTNLVAATETNGDVKIKFSRAGNSQTTVFTIQKSTNGGTTWSSIYSTNRTRVTISGLATTPTWFRVYATRNGTVSSPSQPIAVWTNGSTTELSIAA